MVFHNNIPSQKEDSFLQGLHCGAAWLHSEIWSIALSHLRKRTRVLSLLNVGNILKGMYGVLKKIYCLDSQTNIVNPQLWAIINLHGSVWSWQICMSHWEFVHALMIVSSPPLPVSRKYYSSHGAYSQSKLALVLFTYYLQEQLMAGGFPVIVNAVDPGMVDTALYDNLWTLAQAMKKPVAKILFRVRTF